MKLYQKKQKFLLIIVIIILCPTLMNIMLFSIVSKEPIDLNHELESDLKSARVNNIAMGFDGNDYIIVPDDPSLDLGLICTISFWILLNEISSHVVFLDNMWMYDQGGYQIYYRGDEVTPTFDFVISDGVGYRSMTENSGNHSTIIPSIGSWYHITAVCTGNNGFMILYINGLLQNLWDISFTPDLDPIYGLNIGRSRTGGSYLDGKIDDIKIWNSSLNINQIRNVMCGNDTVQSSNLVLFLNFEQNSGLTCYDQSGNNNDGTITGAIETSSHNYDCSEDGGSSIPFGGFCLLVTILTLSSAIIIISKKRYIPINH